MRYIAQQGLILFSSDLETSRKIKSVTKHIDFTTLGLPKFNLKQSLEYLHLQYQLVYYEGFLLVNGFEYHISMDKMQFEDCGLYCASMQA